ncbi:hypothetical protein BCR42DRAFT_232247 [Absidia repens]|uniref:PHD-type domain-containing protein n=1 Tax=Absidia repens TaxID=90262 RepID=A0A1X2ILX8_9FUNG|nr:hypothetical protein BCR42DRAFT_232247 [Absidia repens]
MDHKDLHHKQQQFTYSPPHHSTEELNEPAIPIQVPTLTPPHHHLQRSDFHSTTNDYGDTPLIDPVKTAATKKHSTTSLATTIKDDQPSSTQYLQPRKRIQSLKKQFTKPNLSVPVPSQSLIHESTVAVPEVTKETSTSNANTATTEHQSFSIATAKTLTASITDRNHFSNNRSRSPSPLVDIEDDSGDTTETDDDDLQQQRRKVSSSESTTQYDDDTTNNLPGGSKQAVIIQQQQQQSIPLSAIPTPPSSKPSQKLKEPLKKHWNSAPPQSPQRPASDQHGSAGFDSSPPSGTADEKLRKPKKKKKKGLTLSQSIGDDDDDARTTLPRPKIRKTGGQGLKPRTKKLGALYCICQTPYDAPRFMIACDRCDQWFHGECIGISEKEGEFIDLYFCDVCGKETGKATSWKPRCGNPACSKAARISSQQGYLSKYCSHNCGMQVARARLELTEMKRRQHSDAAADNIPSIPQLTINKQRQSRLSSQAEKEDHHRLEQLRKQKRQALDVIRMIEQKQSFLGMTEQQLQHGDICGFDPRLVWDDQIWVKVKGMVATNDDSIIMLQYEDNDDDDTVSWQQSTNQQPEKCQVIRKECRQHQQWPKLLEVEMKQERNEQIQVIRMLEKEKQEIKNRMRQRRNEVDLADSLGNGTIIY